MNTKIFKDVMDKIRMSESCEAAIIETVNKIKSEQKNHLNRKQNNVNVK